MTLSDTRSVSFIDLMLTVASYFSLNIRPTEREVKSTSMSIHNDFFFVSNLQSVDFSSPSSKPLTVPDQILRHADLTYFTFRFIVSTATVDICAPISYLSLEFLFRLPQSFINSIFSSTVLLDIPADLSVVTTPPPPPTTYRGSQIQTREFF